MSAKILIFSVDYPPLKVGSGIANYAYNIADNLHKQGKKVIVIAPYSKSCEQFDNKQKFKTLRIPALIFLREFYALGLIFYLTLTGKINKILNFSWFPCGVIALINYYFFKTSYFVFVHGADIIENIKKHPSKKHILRSRLVFLKDLVFKNAKKIFANSSYTKNLVAKKFAQKTLVLNPGINVKEFNKGKPKGLKNKYSFPSKNILLTVSRLDFYKGIDTVIKIMPKLKRQFKDLMYVIVGDGPEKKHLMQLAKKLKVSKNVFFAGAVSNKELKYFYRICTVFIMVSKELKKMGEVEGFGIVYLEAQSYGKPVIASKNSGAVDAVKDKVTGFLVNPKNKKEIQQTIYKLLKEKLLREDMQKQAKLFVKNFSWEKITKKLITALSICFLFIPSLFAYNLVNYFINIDF